MKIKKDQVNLVTSEDQAPSIAFGIGDTGVIIDLLRKRLYSHPLRTMIQEYLCNGRDATREAKSDKALEVTMPTKLDPVFKVRDFGPGLSAERVRNVFVLYGSSTKRKDNSQTGGFGIGAKSAWAYTDSFTIVSIHNGTKSTYIAHLGKSSEGSLDLLEEESTTEPSGVEIGISIQEKDIGYAIQCVYRSTKFWDQKPVFKGILDVELPEEYLRDQKIKGSNFSIGQSLLSWHSLDKKEAKENKGSKKSGLQGKNFWAVIDGIPYEVTKAVTENQAGVFTRGQFYLYFNTGDLQINANREEIVFEESVAPKIKDRLEAMTDELTKQAQEDLEKVEDLQAMIKYLHQEDHILNLFTSKLSFNTKLKGSKFKIMKDKKDSSYITQSFSCAFPDDLLFDTKLEALYTFHPDANFRNVIFLKEETFDKNKWIQFIRNYNYSVSGSQDLSRTLDGVIFVKTKNKAPFASMELDTKKQAKIREAFDSYFKKELEMEKERAKRQQEKQKLQAERELWKNSWGRILDIGYTSSGVYLNTTIFNYDLTLAVKAKGRKWAYVKNLDASGKDKPKFSPELRKTLYFASKEASYSIIVASNETQVKNLEQLGIKPIESFQSIINPLMVMPENLKVSLYENLRATKIPPVFKYIDDEFLVKAKDAFLEDEKTLIKTYRTILSEKPYLDIGFIKTFYAEDFEKAVAETKSEREQVDAWMKKYSLFGCINFRANNWQAEVLKYLQLLNKDAKPKTKK